MAPIRKTAKRTHILTVLSSVHVPMTVQEIKREIDTAVHTATVYRALIDLVESGAVRRVNIHARSVHYESNTDHHHHIVCTQCEKIEDVHTEPKSLDKNVLSNSRSFKMVTSHSLEFFGICKECAK